MAETEDEEKGKIDLTIESVIEIGGDKTTDTVQKTTNDDKAPNTPHEDKAEKKSEKSKKHKDDSKRTTKRKNKVVTQSDAENQSDSKKYSPPPPQEMEVVEIETQDEAETSAGVMIEEILTKIQDTKKDWADTPVEEKEEGSTETTETNTPTETTNEPTIVETADEPKETHIQKRQREAQEWMRMIHAKHTAVSTVKPTSKPERDEPSQFTYAGMVTKEKTDQDSQPVKKWVSKTTVLGNLRCFSKEEAYSLTPKEVMEEIKVQYPEIYANLTGISLLNSTELEITLADERTANRWATGGFSLRGKHITLRKETEGRTMVVIYNLPTTLPEAEILKYISEYGTEVSGFQCHTTGEDGHKIYTGKRIYWLNMHQDKCLPKFPTICGRNAKIKYEGLEERLQAYEIKQQEEKAKEESLRLQRLLEEKLQEEKEREERLIIEKKRSEMYYKDGQLVTSQIHPEQPNPEINKPTALHHKIRHKVMSEKDPRDIKVVQYFETQPQDSTVLDCGRFYTRTKCEGDVRAAVVSVGLKHLLPLGRDKEAGNLLEATGLYTMFGISDQYDLDKIDRTIYNESVIAHWERMSYNGERGLKQAETLLDGMFWDIYMLIPSGTIDNPEGSD